MNLVRRSSTAAYPPISDESIFQQQVEYTVDRCGKIKDILKFPEYLKDLKYCLKLYDYTNILKELTGTEISQLLSNGGSSESSLSLSYKDEKFLDCVLSGTLVGELAEEFESFQVVDQASGLTSILTNWPGYQSSPSLHALKKLEKDGKRKLLELRKSLERRLEAIKLKSTELIDIEVYVNQFEKIFEISVKYNFDKQMSYKWIMEKVFKNICNSVYCPCSHEVDNTLDDEYGYQGYYNISYMVNDLLN